MPWGVVAGAAITAAGSYMSAKDNAPSGGGSNNQYVPTNLTGADLNWQNANQNSANLANQAANMGTGAYNQSYERAQGLNWDPYLQGANQSGQAYGQTANAAMGQMQGYGQQAQLAQGQQQHLYGAGAQVLNTAMDPQNALYDRTAQHLQDQVRAGQAARGLGNSAAGAGEEDQAMSNFNIDWQNNQLARQTQGLQADVNANAAGANQGNQYGANQAAMLAAGSAGAGFYGQAGSVPLQAQQNWAAAPGQAAAQLQGGYANLQQGFSTVANQSIPYMNAGNGALATNWQNAYQTNRDAATGMGQIGSQIGTAAQNYFQQPSSGSPPNPYYNGNTGATYDPSAYSAPGGGDTYYGSGQNWGV